MVTRKAAALAITLFTMGAFPAQASASTSGAPPGAPPHDADRERAGFSENVRTNPWVERQIEAIETEIERYRDLSAEGWNTIGAGETIRPGDTGKRVGHLCERLRITGDWQGTCPPADGDTARIGNGNGNGSASSSGISEVTYGADLEAAVRRFQKRHGIQVDGLVGPETRGRLNMSPHEVVATLRLAVERLHEVREATAGQDRFVLVNIPAYEVALVEEGRTTFRSDVIVGRRGTETPEFSTRITSLTVNPAWHVPASVFRRQLLPKIRLDPDYLAEGGFDVIDRDGRVDPGFVDWWSAEPYSYRYRQRPGPGNALGRIKFESPNRHAIFLHDTPARSLFDRTTRTFSAGCVRVEQPWELAKALLGEDRAPRFEANVERWLDDTRTRHVGLDEPVPLHIVYITASVDGDGDVRLHPDVYDRDRLNTLVAEERSRTRDAVANAREAGDDYPKPSSPSLVPAAAELPRVPDDAATSREEAALDSRAG